MIVPMESRHVPQVAALHFECIHGLLTDLGPGMCRRFYNHALTLPQCFGFVDEEAEALRGFAFCATDNSRLFANWPMRLAVLAHLTGRPWLVRRLLFHVGESFPPAPEALYAAVTPQWRRRGIANALTRAADAEFLRRGIQRYQIRIDKSNQANLQRRLKQGSRILTEYFEGGIARCLLETDVQV